MMKRKRHNYVVPWKIPNWNRKNCEKDFESPARTTIIYHAVQYRKNTFSKHLFYTLKLDFLIQ